MTPLTDLREAGEAALAAALALNGAHETETSPLTPERLEAMLAGAFASPALADGTGFAIAFDEGADYDSPNFRWFRARREQ